MLYDPQGILSGLKSACMCAKSGHKSGHIRVAESCPGERWVQMILGWPIGTTNTPRQQG
jgi:hypothetical protein